MLLMTNPDVAATRRRAALRGEEAVADWRIRTGTWAARVFAVVSAAPALAALFWQGPASVGAMVYSMIVAVAVTVASFRIARGSRWAAVAVLAYFALDKLMAVATYGWRGLYQGALIAAIIAFGLVQGVRGTYRKRSIATVRAREAAGVVPQAL
jgi:hypothetical protein